MPVQTFSYTSQNQIAAQPSGTANILAVSNNAGDTTPTLTVYDATTNEVLQMNGKKEVVTTSTKTDARWLVLDATCTGTVSVYSEDDGIAAVGDIRIDTNPGDGDTVSVGLTGAVTTYTFKTALTPANGEIKIGGTTSATADNLASAINDASTGTTTPVDGTDWQNAGTAPAGANTYVTATVSTNVVTVTDKILCKRLLGWALAQSSTTLSIRQPIGGRNGTLIASITPGETEYYSTDIDLDTEDLATSTLPPLKTGATDSLVTSGKTVTLDINCENVVTAITLKYQVSNDDTNWTDGQTAITNADNNHQYITPTEHIQYIRLNITANANTTASALNAKVIH